MIITLFPLLLTFAAGWYAVFSLITFGVYAWDKYRATNAAWRVREQTLHQLEMLGGWPGALIAQRVLRHKRRKAAYMARFWRIVATHVAVWCLILVIRFG